MGLVLVFIVAILLLAVFPRWRHSRTWGYAPTGAVGIVLLIMVILLAVGVLRAGF